MADAAQPLALGGVPELLGMGRPGTKISTARPNICWLSGSTVRPETSSEAL